MNPPLRAHIDFNRLVRNANQLALAARSQKLLAVVKANAYGHGLLPCARALSAPEAMTDGFAVARLQEAVRLRAAGVGGRIVVLAGCMEPAELEAFAYHGIDLVVQAEEQVIWLEEAPETVNVTVWLKIDSGMHRLGIAAQEVAPLWTRLKQCPRVLGNPRLMTHLANADNPHDNATLKQVAAFNEMVDGLAGERSIANSGGLLGWPETGADWARPGIALYGISPFAEGIGEGLGLEPVMTLTTRLVAVKEVSAGAPIGYGGTWRCPEAMRIGVAAVGYADGYPRHAPPGTPVLVDGSPAAVIGRVSMDLMTVDLRAAPAARVESTVTLWGDGLPVEDVARAIGCIPYELVAGLGQRVEYD